MRQLFNILCLVILSTESFASTAASNWAKANTAFQQKQYDSAIYYYQQIIPEQTQNAEVYYNLGNTYYRLNKIADAVLQYERALFYNPSLFQAKDNLLLAKNRIPNAIKHIPEIFFIRWWHQLTASNTATRWAVLSLICFLVILVLILLRVLRKGQVHIPIQVYFFLPLINIIFLVFAFTATYNGQYSPLAVVMNSNSPMTLIPNSSKGQSLIPEGTTVETGQQKSNWIEVTLPDNRTGWMQITELSFVYSSKK